MEEKEERIFIRKGTARELCTFIYRDGCAGEMHCCSCAISIPRSEVIDRMAKAICADDFLVEGYHAMAEKALNALLEDTK